MNNGLRRSGGARLTTKEGRETLDVPLDKLDKLMQHLNERLTLDNLALTEGYLKGQFRVHVHLRHHILAASGRHPVDYCAIFQRELAFGSGDVRGRREGLGGSQSASQIGVVGDHTSKVMDNRSLSHAHRYQELMLVNNVELVEPPEGVVRSLVRLGRLDEVYRSLRCSLYRSRRTGIKSIGEAGSASEHGKLGTFADLIPLGTDQLAYQQIEGRAEVVDSIPEDGAPPKGRLARGFDLKDQVARIKLTKAEDSIWFWLPFWVQKPLDQSFQITDVLFSPFDLYPDIAEVGLASHGPEEQNEGSAITTFYLATSALVSQGQRRTVGRAVQRLPRLPRGILFCCWTSKQGPTARVASLRTTLAGGA